MAPAPELRTAGWLNVDRPLSLAELRGKVVLIEAFQMLCPGCVSEALPLAQRVHQSFGREDVAVIGLHTVFEHHAAQGSREALEAFLHEYRLSFPVAMDAAAEDSPIPQTMALYAMQGTPTLLLVDRQGRLRLQRFGHVPELELGAQIMALMRETDAAEVSEPVPDASGHCDADGCSVD